MTRWSGLKWTQLGQWLIRPRTVLGLFVVLLAAYLFVLHPWLMSWGATPQEQAMVLPGDALAPDARFRVTRAITVHAPPERIWPWLMQIGQDRGGFYSYEWLENLFSARMPRVNEVRAEWGTRQIGEAVPMARPDYFGGALGDAINLRVKLIDPPHAVWHDGLFVLLPIDASTTRVVWREYGPTTGPQGIGGWFGAVFGRMVYDDMHFVMVRQMLRGIQANAEGHPYPPLALTLLARLGWLGATLALLALGLRRRGGWPWLLLPLALAYVTVWKTGDWDAAMAGCLSLGISLLGFAVWGRRWTAPFALVAAFVLLVLLFAPDAWIAFGLIFLALWLGLGWAAFAAWQRRSHPTPTTARAM